MNDKYNVSFYKNIFKSNEGQIISFENFINDVKNEKYKRTIDTLRTLFEENKTEDFKRLKKSLPAITPSGTFTQRKESCLLKHSQILSLDFDSLEDPLIVKNVVINEKWVLAAFISPSGKGLKVFVHISPDKHKAAFTQLKKHFGSSYNINSDKGCHDVTRLCFVSSDKAAYINLNAEMFNVTEINEIKNNYTATTINSKPNKDLLNEISIITDRIEDAKIDICKDYPTRLKLGFALAEVGEAAREYFYRICYYYTGSSEISPEIQFNECLKKRKKGVNYQSFFYIAKEAGIDINIFSPPLPNNHNEKGRFKNDYGEEVTDRERIEISINELFEVRRNIILDRIECKERNKENAKWKPANEHNISRELEFKRVKNCSPNRIKSILESDFVAHHNPFKTYFENLPIYDKKNEPDYIQLLSEIVQLKNEGEDRERFNRHFKKALIRCVACSLTDEVNNLHYNKHAIIFISPLQSIGKSGFIRFLIPTELELYSVENMTFGNRDEDFTMQSSFIINLDEMASIEEKNLQRVKSAMSKGMLNVRKMNSGDRIIEPRRCNFWGNTNLTNILKDDTGSVRWLCFEVIGFNKELEYWKTNSPLYVDINKVWAMAYKLFKDGVDFQLTAKELKENEKVNEMYKEESIEEQLIKSHISIAEKDRLNLKSTGEIVNLLAAKNPFLATRLNINKVGAALKNLGFIYGQEFDKGKGYQLKGYYIKE